MLPDLLPFQCFESHTFWNQVSTKRNLSSTATVSGYSKSGVVKEDGNNKRDTTISKEEALKQGFLTLI
jgi:hypothetical protein